MWRWVAILVLMSLPAAAQMMMTGIGRQGGGGGGSCSNQLDFAQACNSQYLTVVR